MRQRNDQDHPLTVHTDPPQVVQPGDTIDHPDPVVGLTVLNDHQPEPDPPAGKPAARVKASTPKETQ